LKAAGRSTSAHPPVRLRSGNRSLRRKGRWKTGLPRVPSPSNDRSLKAVSRWKRDLPRSLEKPKALRRRSGGTGIHRGRKFPSLTGDASWAGIEKGVSAARSVQKVLSPKEREERAGGVNPYFSPFSCFNLYIGSPQVFPRSRVLYIAPSMPARPFGRKCLWETNLSFLLPPVISRVFVPACVFRSFVFPPVWFSSPSWF